MPCCGYAEPCYFKTDGEPCWGAVRVVDAWGDELDRDEKYEDFFFMHACEGHSDNCFGRPYKERPPTVLKPKEDAELSLKEYEQCWGGYC